VLGLPFLKLAFRLAKGGRQDRSIIGNGLLSDLEAHDHQGRAKSNARSIAKIRFSSSVND
jgi:hypothetical protein